MLILSVECHLYYNLPRLFPFAPHMMLLNIRSKFVCFAASNMHAIPAATNNFIVGGGRSNIDLYDTLGDIAFI